MNHIVLGYDGSDFSVQALDWALDEAELRKLSLTVAHSWQWPYGEADEEAKNHLRKAADHVLWHGAECARSTSSVVGVETDLYEGPAAQRLVELSSDAALVVVGSRGLHGLPGALVGSVARYVAAHAECPVIVVRGPGPLPALAHPGPIVVADKEPTASVLEFAADEADMRRLALVTTAGPKAWQESHPNVASIVQEAHKTPTLIVAGRKRADHLGTIASLLQHAPCPVAVVGTSRGKGHRD
ncbi:universal stress protein [Nonomuraea guangzhouensis]|uniref:Universal stress protein n=1 Tax=Nonomuraea guangzhouensis TaxID=1291555 RepID=A0ABW4GIV9_9ACTN|nr:universal stress protein [Nonomuraea guangzhouensis]